MSKFKAEAQKLTDYARIGMETVLEDYYSRFEVDQAIIVALQAAHDQGWNEAVEAAALEVDKLHGCDWTNAIRLLQIEEKP